MAMQIEDVIAKRGKGDLDKLLRGNETWVIS
jgi:2-oxoglutarate ferredoxin oxidoreductase subunit beta